MKKALAVFMVGILLLPLLLGAGSQALVIGAKEDAYVAADFNDPADKAGLRQQNTGAQDFLKTGYRFAISGQEMVMSIIYLRFDLSPLQDKEIESVFLQLYARSLELPPPARLVDVYRVEGEWSEGTLTFANAPSWDEEPAATAAVYSAGRWYSWDITAEVIGQRQSEISLCLMLREVTAKGQEQAIFNSREAVHSQPRLLVTYGRGAMPASFLYGLIALLLLMVVAAFFLGRRWRGKAGRPRRGRA